MSHLWMLQMSPALTKKSYCCPYTHTRFEPFVSCVMAECRLFGSE